MNDQESLKVSVVLWNVVGELFDAAAHSDVDLALLHSYADLLAAKLVYARIQSNKLDLGLAFAGVCVEFALTS